MYQENSNQDFQPLQLQQQQQQQQHQDQHQSQQYAQQYDQYYFNYQNYYQHNYAQYNQYYNPYYNYYNTNQYQQDTNQQYNYQTTDPKPSTPTPIQTYATNDATPEKQNDSGIDVISPQIQYQFQQAQIYENKQIEKIEENDDNDDESIEEDDDKENDENQSSSKSSSKMDPAKPPKPYLEIIADGILSNKVKMMQLHEIYNFMEKKYEYFAKNVNKSWRNSVRHNLSLNECFVKAGRGSNGKGNYWKIHPACEKEFIRGNFRRKTFKKLIRSQHNENQQSQTASYQYRQTDSSTMHHHGYPINYTNIFNSNF